MRTRAGAGTGLVPVRRRLFLLAAAAIAPLAGLAAFGLTVLIAQQHEQAARAAVELSRALATAVDAELGRSMAVLEAVATSPTLDGDGDRAAFHRRAMRVVGSQPNWRAIVLVDEAGTSIVDSRVPYGTAPPVLAEREALARVRASRLPTVGNLVDQPGVSADRPELDFSVSVPVVRDGVLRFVMVALVNPDVIVAIVNRQRVPDDWVISIFDTAGRRVARSRAHAENLGKPGAPSVVALMAQPAEEGWGRTIAIEGDPIYTAYSRARDVRWTVATGIPVALVDRAAWRFGLLVGGGIVLSIVIAALAALGVARSIAVPVAALERAAEALGRREPPVLPVTGIQEIRQVGEALLEAAAERTRAEGERETLLARAQQARAAAEAANRAKDEFLAMLGHELRNPLGAISNAVGLLEHPRAGAEQRDHARAVIARQTVQLARLTDDLLEAGRVITGKIVLTREPLELAAAVARTLATFAGRPKFGRRRLESDLHPVWVEADAARIEQIVVNLIENAVKFTRDDGTIRVTVTVEDGAAALRVADDGLGMSSELTARVFDLFVQGDRSLDRSAGGLGIGLTVVRRIVELHGGSVRATSAGAGQGSEICARLPALAAAPAVNRVVTPPPTAATGAARDVLVVEDNDDARAALAELLALAGHRVRVERDGAAGLATALATRPEVVLIDVGLPGIDGYEVARRLRAAREGGRRMTLIALTGYGLPEDRRRALAAGFDVHLVKPVDFAALSEILAR